MIPDWRANSPWRSSVSWSIISSDESGFSLTWKKEHVRSRYLGLVKIENNSPRKKGWVCWRMLWSVDNCGRWGCLSRQSGLWRWWWRWGLGWGLWETAAWGHPSTCSPVGSRGPTANSSAPHLKSNLVVTNQTLQAIRVSSPGWTKWSFLPFLFLSPWTH